MNKIIKEFLSKIDKKDLDYYHIFPCQLGEKFDISCEDARILVQDELLRRGK